MEPAETKATGKSSTFIWCCVLCSGGGGDGGLDLCLGVWVPLGV